jgi:3-dehydroquinate synthase
VETTQKTIHVELGTRGYDVVVGPGAIDRLPEVIRARCGGTIPRRAMLVLDAGIGTNAEFSAQVAAAAMASVRDRCITLSIQPSEQVKSMETLERLLAEMTRGKLERNEPVIAVGGGIVCDVAGFAAATYRRGVPVVQCPTTLLAMVDASVGGKTGVNLRVGDSLKKNMVGAFHQPVGVLADVRALKSLAEREFRAGLAECIKHALIARGLGAPEVTSEIGADLAAAGARSEIGITAMIARHVALKAMVVSGDEREEAPSTVGGRALLNLGHTFGHAIETLGDLIIDDSRSSGPLLHGEAVALGLCAAAACAGAMGLIAGPMAQEVTKVVASAGLPTRASGLPSIDVLIGLMQDDKKTSGGRLRVILPTSWGESRVVEGPPSRAVRAGWAAIGAP